MSLAAVTVIAVDSNTPGQHLAKELEKTEIIRVKGSLRQVLSHPGDFITGGRD